MLLDFLRAANFVSERERILRASGAAEVTAGFDKVAAVERVCAVLSGLNVAHALIGGLAVGVRSGVPRATLDVDFAVSTQVDRDWLTAQMNAHGFSSRGRFEHSLNFVHESGEPVQLAFDPNFDAFIARAEMMELGGLKVAVVMTADLIEMKRRVAADPARRRSNALRDLADIALLEGDIPGPDEGW